MRSLRLSTLPAFLIAGLLALTSVALGHARGNVMARGEVILCTGAGPVVVTLDASGDPVGTPHVCPDMALGLIAGLAAPVVLPAPAGDGRFVPARPGTALLAPAARHAPAARGPPLAV